MWRLLHGQLYVQHQPQVLVVMIGTNDLGAASCRGGEPAIAEAANGAARRYFTCKFSLKFWMYWISIRKGSELICGQNIQDAS